MNAGVLTAWCSETGRCAGRAAAQRASHDHEQTPNTAPRAICGQARFSTFRHFAHHEAVRDTAARTFWITVKLFAFVSMFGSSSVVEAAEKTPVLLGIPVDFILFASTLIAVAVFHHYTLHVALTGLAVIVVYKLGFTGFKTGPGFEGFLWHMHHEWVILTNLLCLLVGFALLSNHFERSRLPDVLPRFLPDDWMGCFALLTVIFVLSGFLDALQSPGKAHVMFCDGEPEPQPHQDEKSDQSDVRIMHEPRADETGKSSDRARALLEKIVDEIAVAGLGAEQPQYALAQHERTRNLDQGADNGDEQDIDRHRASSRCEASHASLSGSREF